MVWLIPMVRVISQKCVGSKYPERDLLDWAIQCGRTSLKNYFLRAFVLILLQRWFENLSP